MKLRAQKGYHRLGLVLSIPLAFTATLLFVLGVIEEAAAVCLVLAVSIYIVCRSIPWVVEGFREPE